MLISEIVKHLEMLKNSQVDLKVYIPSRHEEDAYEEVTLAVRDSDFKTYYRNIKGRDVKKGIIII